MLNGKFRCIKQYDETFMLEGKVYEFVDGSCIREDGERSSRYKSIGDFNFFCYTRIEPVEKKVFTKNDLKTGMWCKLRNGNKIMILLNTVSGDVFSGDTWGILSNYNDDLTCKKSVRNNCDIIKVYSPIPNIGYLNNDFINMIDYARDNLTLIWERKEKTESELRLEQAIKQLEEAQNNVEEAKKLVKELK